jgi:predicted site-specific integrase-resolvase
MQNAPQSCATTATGLTKTLLLWSKEMACLTVPFRARPVQTTPAGSLVRLQVAARACNVSTSSVRRACNEGFVPVTVLASGHRRVRVGDVQAHFLGLQAEDTGKADALENGTQGNSKVVAIYARVSSDHQKNDLLTQTADLERRAKESFPTQAVRVYSEIGSGANSDRPQFNRLIGDMLAGKISVLLIKVRDRLSRTSFGIVERLAERCGVQIVITEPENDPKDGTSELMADIQSLFVLYNARQNGKRAGKRAMFIAPEGLRERVASLYGAGTSFREMKGILPKEGWRCANTGKVVTDHMVYLVFKDVRAGLREKKGSEAVTPRHVREFVAKHCTIGAGKNVYALPLMKTYAAYCRQAGVEPLNSQTFSRALHALGRFRYEKQSTGRFRVFGICLRGNERATRTFKAPVCL